MMEINKEAIMDMLEHSEKESEFISELVDSLVFKCCDKLDSYIEYVRSLMNGDNYSLTDSELDDIILTIPTLLYFVGTQQEKLGIKHDVTKTARNFQYSKLYTETVGTVGTKENAAKMDLLDNDLLLVVYNRAYNIIKSKSDAAMELLQSAKKVASRRMTELELTNSTPNKMK